MLGPPLLHFVNFTYVTNTCLLLADLKAFPSNLLDLELLYPGVCCEIPGFIPVHISRTLIYVLMPLHKWCAVVHECESEYRGCIEVEHEEWAMLYLANPLGLVTAGGQWDYGIFRWLIPDLWLVPCCDFLFFPWTHVHAVCTVRLYHRVACRIIWLQEQSVVRKI